MKLCRIRVSIRAMAATCLLTCSSYMAAAWQPKQAPLMTEWASKVSGDNVLPEYPRPQMVRPEWKNLNGVWELERAAEGQPVPVGQTLGESILVPFPVESALSGIMRHEDRLWYRRTFTVPEKWAGQRVLLHFGAVDWLATVFVNGRNIGNHQGGYDSFSFDITDALNEGENELIVNVFDPTDLGTQPLGKQRIKPHGYWYTPTTGIWQTVWMEPVPPASIRRLEMIPDVAGGKLNVIVHGTGLGGRILEVSATAEGKVVGTGSGIAGEVIALPVPDSRLWSPDDPFLYDLTVSAKSGTGVEDRVTSYFGMRSISVGKVNGITRPLLNGKFVFQLGTLDQGYWPDGNYTAPTDEALKSDLIKHKDLGFNTVRKHIKVEPDRWFYWADKLGLLVWQDMPAMRNHEQPDEKLKFKPDALVREKFDAEWRAIISQHISSPSVVMWVIFNEGWAQYDRDETIRITNETKMRDPSRLVNNASGWHDSGAGDVRDIHDYPGPKADAASETRFSALGEYGGIPFNVEGHTWNGRRWGYGEIVQDEAVLNKTYAGMIGKIRGFLTSPGLSATIYTQITDVEGEINGLFTYDRKVSKFDAAMLKALHGQVIADANAIQAGAKPSPPPR